MILKPSPICSSMFVFNNNTFIGEISDFGPKFDFGRVYDDACDEGFSIISKKTGKHAVFAFENHETDLEGELIAWVFKCVTPGLKYLEAKIFND